MDLNSASSRSLIYLVLAAGTLWLLYLLAPILTPFIAGAALAYLCDPLADRLERLGLSRTLGTTLVLLGLMLLLALLVLVLTPLIQAQVDLLTAQVPHWLDWGQKTLLPRLQSSLGINLSGGHAELAGWLKAHVGELGRLTAYLPEVGSKGLVLLGILANLVLIPVVTFYLLRDWDRLTAAAAELVPATIRPAVTEITREIDSVLSEFVRGQILVILIMALFYSVGLWLAGLDYALAVGMIAGLLVFIPYLGVTVGVLLGTMACLGQHGDLVSLLPVWGVFAVGQVLEGMVITPRLVGERVGLHPVAVLFALMAFGRLFGFFGVLLAIPASAALLVALRRLRSQLGAEPQQIETAEDTEKLAD